MARVSPDPLVKVRLNRLFDDKSVEIALEPDAPTVITGSNGSGKTTLLRAIDAVSRGRWQALQRLPLHGIELSFASGKWITATISDKSITVQDSSGEKRRIPREPNSPEQILNIARRHGFEAWPIDEDRVEYNGTVITVDEFADHLREMGLTGLLDSATKASGVPSASSVQFNSRLLSTDRVNTAVAARGASFPRRGAISRRTVDRLPDDVRRLMAEAQQAYARQSQELDRTLPRRIVAAMRDTDSSSREEAESTATKTFERVKSIRGTLMELGLLREAAAEGVDSSWISDDDVLPVVRLILDDTAAKYAELEPVERDLTSFRDFVHARLRNKRLRFSGDKGFEVVVERPGQDAAIVRPSSLSSGEQQLIILAHAVSLEVPTGTVVLVDEPELSLHPEWQEDLLEDLERLAIERGVQFVLATHSPILGGTRPELRRSLDTSDDYSTAK